MERNFRNLNEVLETWAVERPNNLAYRSVSKASERKITFSQLHDRANAIARDLDLRINHVYGERIILMMGQDLGFLEGFFGCLYAGAIPVPVALPKINRSPERLRNIIHDSGARTILTTNDVLEFYPQSIRDRLNSKAEIMVLDEHGASNTLVKQPNFEIRANDTAFLQYTSGSTRNPKGVMVSHANVLANEKMIRDQFGHSDTTIVVSWLPNYHDMGLVGMLLQPLFLGRPCHFMPPSDFIQKPLRWFQLITQTRATTTGAPYFALQHCLERCADSDLSEIDLSSVEIFFCGSEPIHSDGVERFLERFSKCGLKKEAFYPCYGLAEATLMVSGNDKNELYQTDLRKPSQSKTGQKIGVFVGCGHPHPLQTVKIVDPDTTFELEGGTIGEIWVKGPAVTQGYWGNESETQKIFNAFTSSGDGPFLRTGDLGYQCNKQLFITGRIKDVIIIRGENHFPNDIEWTVYNAGPWFMPGGVAVVMSDRVKDGLIILAELRRECLRKVPLPEKEEIKTAVIQAHGVLPARIHFLKTGVLPKTTSGKLQRWKCRELYELGTLENVEVTTGGSQ